MCDLYAHLLAAVGRIDGIMGMRAYKKDISGFLPTHVRLLNLFDL
jgi:hypothetical protein